ncbi:hypothetical protein [Paucisalibacillus sp. EB02]|uniref:hypothetical protein n=1 Tax=Paucisalibacillus sp. EB02 TaxID=1347087 RepID=UPI0004BA85DF|nr:hypothetical protein [Paucisalibacillus sp. EB02]
MKKDTLLFWMFFVVMFSICISIHGLIFNSLIPFNSFTSLLAILLIIVAVIPSSAILAEKINNYALRKGLRQGKNFKIFIIGTLAIGVLIISINTFNHFREHNLDDLIGYTSLDFDYLGFTTDWNSVPEDQRFEWVGYQKETVDELMNFLSQYRVKFQNTDNMSGRTSFEFVINHKITNPSMVHVLNEKDIRINHDIYEVVNGSIDMEWIRAFNQANKEKYGF